MSTAALTDAELERIAAEVAGPSAPQGDARAKVAMHERASRQGAERVAKVGTKRDGESVPPFCQQVIAPAGAVLGTVRVEAWAIPVGAAYGSTGCAGGPEARCAKCCRHVCGSHRNSACREGGRHS